jgi:alkyldihydroxyacetonephosphate synthase
MVDPLGPGAPTAPIPLASPGMATAHLDTTTVAVPDVLLDQLGATGAEVSVDPTTRAEASRDWWPLAMTWASQGEVAVVAGAVVRPSSPDQVALVLRLCRDAGVPVTAAGGRSGVEGGSVPLFGGVVLDLCGLDGVRSVDADDLVVDVLAGTFGDRLEDELRTEHGLTIGHWPQSVSLSTVGGWLACRGAGQLSNRYGKVEDLVLGLDVVLADGTRVVTGGHDRQAVGPDLTQLFVGSEGTLGVITAARLRAWPLPAAEHRAAYGFPSFEAGADACRRIVQRGLAPAALRLYDPVEGERSHGTGDRALLLVFDEGDPKVVDAARRITSDACADAEVLDPALVGHWLSHRNDVSALQAFVSGGYVVDTLELTTSWSALPAVYPQVRDAIAAVPGVVASSAHLSHSYPGGACLYFTFGGRPESDTAADRDAFHHACWDAGTRTSLALGASLSHHHGVGLNRARFVGDALGPGALGVLSAVKAALDPTGILNPGKLGLSSPFGAVPPPFAAPPSTPPSDPAAEVRR